MRPVAIFRHFPSEGPGYFATFLDAHRIPWTLIAIDRNDPVPRVSGELGESGSAASAPSRFPYSGLCFMGGPMSVNDPLPWIDDACALIRQAAAAGVPVIGHCLGSQLMAKALGGTVGANPVKEIGWGPIEASAGPAARHWLGGIAAAPVFHWHGETFTLPPGAERLAASPACANQMFALGPHLGMQCHVEMTPEMIAEWSLAWPGEVAGLDPLPPSVQTPERMSEDTPRHLPAMRALADRLYGEWIKGLARD
ncbi:type 1 glutamine amidotransferase [Oryzomicrobium sp.]|uniref:type 1 glutamine amidotransferase n=1 Tax=Oryzomicrobium sp. TaxID=1911578 RepID=UPI002FE12FC9